MSKMANDAVCRESHELGLCTELVSSEGGAIGVLAPKDRAGTEPDLRAVLATGGFWDVQALTPDGAAFLDLFAPRPKAAAPSLAARLMGVSPSAGTKRATTWQIDHLKDNRFNARGCK